MTFRPDPSVLVPINSQRGVDGSVSPLKLTDGFCRELENADITTAGIIKKRGGYVTAGGALPVSVIQNTLYNKEYPAGKRPYLVSAHPLTDNYGLKLLRESVGYVQFPADTEDYFFLVEFWQDPDYPVTENTTFYFYTGGSPSSPLLYEFAPLAVYAGKYALLGQDAYVKFRTYNSGGLAPAWASFTASWNFVIGAATTVWGRKGYVWALYPNEYITDVTVLSSYRVKITTSAPLKKGTMIKFHGGGDRYIGYVVDTDDLTYYTIYSLNLFYGTYPPDKLRWRYCYFSGENQEIALECTVAEFQDVCWSPSLGKFCAVSLTVTSETIESVVSLSSNGTTWTSYLSGTEIMNSVAWSPALGIFCAVGSNNSGSSRQAYTSADGITWTPHTVTYAYDDICWSPGLGLFCAVTSNKYAISSDGITWSEGTITGLSNAKAITWSPGLGLFCVVSNGGANRAATSPDGTTWTAVTAQAKDWRDICWSPGLGLFCAVALGPSVQGVMTSPDGTTWTLQTTPNRSYLSVDWSPALGLFVASATYAGGTQACAITSVDGATWNSSTAYSENYGFPEGTCWSPDLGVFCVVQWAGVVPGSIKLVARRSTDGVNWTFPAVFDGLYQPKFDNSLFEAFDIVNTPTDRSLLGLGVQTGDVQSVESYYDVVEDRSSLASLSHGRIYNLSNPYLWENVYTIDAPPAFTSTATVAGVNGSFAIPFTNASTYYQVGDSLVQNTYDSDGDLTSSLQMTVTAATSSILTVTASATSITYRTGEIWHYTRSSTIIPSATIVSGTSYSSEPQVGDTIFLGGIGKEYPAHELWYSSILTAHSQDKFVFSAPVVFSSGSYLYVQKRWDEVQWPTEILPPIKGASSTTGFTSTFAQYGPATYPVNSELISSAPYSGACFFASKEDGIYRLNGTEVHSLKLVRPQIESIRSIPGTKGQFPIRVGANGVKIGKQVEAIFVYSYYDSTNRLMESEVSTVEEGIFSPKAATDGSDYAELVEFRISPIPALTQTATSKLRLDVYLRITDPSTDSDIDYVYYRTVTPVTGAVTSVVVGDLSPEYLDGNKLCYFFKEGQSHWSGPRAKYLTTVADRLVALNCKSWDYFKLKIPKVFRTDGTFGAYLYWCCPPVSSAGVPSFSLSTSTDSQFFMFPLGVYAVATGGAPSTVTYRPINSVAEVGAYPTAYPTVADAAYPYPTFTTVCVDYTNVWNGTTGCSVKGDSAPKTDLYLTYGDVSDRFSLVNAATTSVVDQRVKLRFAGSAKPEGLPIDFTGDTFVTKALSGGTTATLRGSTRWMDSSLDSNGVPLALRNTSLLEFPEGTIGGVAFTENVAMRISASSIKEKDYMISIDTVGGVTQIRYLYQTGLANPIYPTAGRYVVLSGPGTLGNVRKLGSQKILSFDKDLTFLAGSALATAVEIGSDATATKISYTAIVLTPGEFEVDATGAYTWKPFEITADQIVTAGAEEYSINIFERAALTNPSTLSGFTIPSTTLRVTHATARIDTLFAAGDYAVFELSDQDVKTLPAGFPRLMPGAFRVLTTGGAGPYWVDLAVPFSPEFRSATTTSDTIYLDDYSFVVNPKKIFAVSNGVLTVKVCTGAQPYQGTSAATISGRFSYLNIRGAAFESANLDLSGFYPIASGSVASGVAAFDTQLTSIDYSKITGIRYSSCTYSNYGIPVPAPLKLATAESLFDLALPVFSTNPLLTNVGLVQVGKRITSAINTLLPHWFYAFNDSYFAGGIEVEPNEIAITCNKGTDKYVSALTDSIYTVSPFLWDLGFYFSVKTADSSVFYRATVTSSGATTKLNITGITPHNSTLYTSITDNFPNRIQWTNPVSAVVTAPNVPMFCELNRSTLDTQDDSEITGATAYQNTLIVQKKNSLWRGTFSDVDGSLYFQRIQSPVGGLSHNNMPSNMEHMYFLNSEGVFKYDGTNVDPVFKLNNLFQDHVVKNEYLLSRTAGYADHKNKQLYLGAPYVSSYITDTADVDGQFVYSYNDGVLGWSVNKGLDAYKWASLDGEYYFASSRGRVFRLRSEPFLTRYRDGESAIPFVLSTRFLTAGETTKFKFWRNVLFQFGTTSTYNMQVSYQLDFKSTVYPLETYSVVEASVENGAKWYGNDRLLKGLRETLGQRVNQISFLFEEASIDTDCPIYSVNVEGFQTNTRLVPQKNTRAGGDR